VSGTLFVVATPIGNLDDLSPRAREILAAADAIVCEDTRRTSRLTERFGLETPMISFHRFNERARHEPLLERLHAGEDLALVSDGGTPVIADPGAELVRAALDAGLRVCPIPGASAVTTLLSASGFPGDRYLFEGFLPHRAGERRRRLRALRGESHPVILFESPHRVTETLQDLQKIFGERRMVLGREFTKLHECVIAGSAREIAERMAGDSIRGEISLVIGPTSDDDGAVDDDQSQALLERWRATLESTGGDRRAAMKQLSRESGLRRPELQRLLDELDPDRR
jgi:16S rRNA (cytidine1402-2'-O)-methyltransferase